MNFINLNKTTQRNFTFDKKNSKNVVFFQNLSGKLEFNILETGIELYVFGVYTSKKSEKYKIETIQRHIAPQSLSDLFIKGVFNDESKFLYEGLIRLEKGAQQSHAYQKNQNLILSPQVFVDSRPFLEILANDVFCTHGSTTGKINPLELEYLRTRGINKKDAENLIVQGFIDDIYLKVKDKVKNFSL